MASDEDKHELPLDPSDWERTELYDDDDPSIADAIHDARTEIFDDDPLDVSDVTVAPAGAGRWRAWLWIAGALALGVGALAGVDHFAGRERLAQPATSPPTARHTSQRASADATTPVADATPGPVPANYTAAFRRHQAAVQRCLSNHAADAGDTRRVTLRLDIGTDGAVDRAVVEPDAIAHSALGTCLVRVARAARFARQDQPVGIRIPIALRRR